jgi:hypothetical protein
MVGVDGFEGGAGMVVCEAVNLRRPTDRPTK